MNSSPLAPGSCPRSWCSRSRSVASALEPSGTCRCQPSCDHRWSRPGEPQQGLCRGRFGPRPGDSVSLIGYTTRRDAIRAPRGSPQSPESPRDRAPLGRERLPFRLVQRAEHDFSPAHTTARCSPAGHGHTPAFHGFRAPAYAAELTMRASADAAKFVGGTLRWVSNTEGEPVRLTVARREDAADYPAVVPAAGRSCRLPQLTGAPPRPSQDPTTSA